MFLRSTTNYNTHKEAEEAFKNVCGYAHLALHKDGSASINMLTKSPADKSQVEYDPIDTDGRYNF